MKLTFAFTLYLVSATMLNTSCTSKKEEIVERQKAIVKVLSEREDERVKHPRQLKEGEEAFSNLMRTPEERALQKEYDSLEVELKKY